MGPGAGRPRCDSSGSQPVESSQTGASAAAQGSTSSRGSSSSVSPAAHPAARWLRAIWSGRFRPHGSASANGSLECWLPGQRSQPAGLHDARMGIMPAVPGETLDRPHPVQPAQHILALVPAAPLVIVRTVSTEFHERRLIDGRSDTCMPQFENARSTAWCSGT